MRRSDGRSRRPDGRMRRHRTAYRVQPRNSNSRHRRIYNAEPPTPIRGKVRRPRAGFDRLAAPTGLDLSRHIEMLGHLTHGQSTPSISPIRYVTSMEIFTKISDFANSYQYNFECESQMIIAAPRYKRRHMIRLLVNNPSR